MRAANNRRLLLSDGSPQGQNPSPSNLTQAAAEDATAAQFDSSSMAVTALVLLSGLFFLVFFSVYACRFFAADHDDDQSRRRSRRAHLPPYRGRRGLPSSSSAPALDPMALRALPLLLYSGAGKERDGCVVCLREFEEKDAIKAIPGCGHVFHPDCIDSWLLCHGSCPMCRSTQLFELSSCGEAGVDVCGWAPVAERSAGEDATATGAEDLARTQRAAEVTVDQVAVVGGGSEEEGGRRVGKKLRLIGRSDSWSCRTHQGASNLTRSRSL